MPTFKHGKGVAVLVDEYDFSSYFNDMTATSSVDTAETSTFGTSAKSYVTGHQDGTVSSVVILSPPIQSEPTSILPANSLEQQSKKLLLCPVVTPTEPEQFSLSPIQPRMKCPHPSQMSSEPALSSKPQMVLSMA